MKPKILFLLLLLLIGNHTAKAIDIVPGFTYSGMIIGPRGSTYDYYQDSGEGGNELYYVLQNRAKCSGELQIDVEVDWSRPYTEEYQFLPGAYIDGVHQRDKNPRTKPFYWNLSFTFYWEEYSYLLEKQIWINYVVTDWNSEEYKGII